MPDPRSPEQHEPGVRLVAPAEIGDTPALYSNHVQITATPEDFTLHLGWYSVPPFAEPPKVIVDVPIRPLVKVSLPLNLIRGILIALESQLEAWEKNWGPLPPHPNPPARAESQESAREHSS